MTLLILIVATIIINAIGYILAQRSLERKFAKYRLDHNKSILTLANQLKSQEASLEAVLDYIKSELESELALSSIEPLDVGLDEQNEYEEEVDSVSHM